MFILFGSMCLCCSRTPPTWHVRFFTLLFGSLFLSCSLTPPTWHVRFFTLLFGSMFLSCSLTPPTWHVRFFTLALLVCLRSGTLQLTFGFRVRLRCRIIEIVCFTAGAPWCRETFVLRKTSLNNTDGYLPRKSFI